MSTLAMGLWGRPTRPSESRVTSKTRITLVAVGVVAVGFAVAFAVGAFRSNSRTTFHELCGNSLCLRLPSSWSGRIESGSADQLIAAPFMLPSWVGQHEQGVISIPQSRFFIVVFVYQRGYLLGWPRKQTIAISADRLKLQRAQRGEPRSVAQTMVTFRDRSLSAWVWFRDSRPSQSQLAAVNRVLATLHPAPPPRTTS
jgi:hypothetical protein